MRAIAAGTVSTMPRVFASHARPAIAPARQDRRRGATEPPRSPSWRGVDWASHLRRGQLRRRRGELRGHRLRRIRPAPIGRPSCSSTASAASGRTGSRTCPARPSSAASSPLDLPGFGLSPMPSEPISIPCYAAVVEELCRAPRPREGRAGRQLDGRLRRRRAGDPTAQRGSSGSCSCPPPASPPATCTAAPAVTLGPRRRRGHGLHRGPRTARRPPAAICRHMALGARGAPPQPPGRRPGLGGDDQGRGQARLQRTPCARTSTSTSASGCPRSPAPR